jgi:hypothetical protein
VFQLFDLEAAVDDSDEEEVEVEDEDSTFTQNL